MNARPRPIGGSDERVVGFVAGSRVVSTALMFVNFLFFMICLMVSLRVGVGFLDAVMSFPGSLLDVLGSKSGFRIFQQGDWWRLVSAGMLHGGLLHFGMNTWVLYDVGPLVEEFYGRYRMLLIYVLGSVAGFAASLLWSPNVASVGASAGICALIGAMIAYGYQYRSSAIAAIQGHFIRWVAYMIIIGLIVPMIDNAAHIGGLAGGFAVAWILGGRALIGDWRESLTKGAFYATLAVVLYTIFRMIQNLLIALNQ
jgi:rhomboid protease GluP